MSELLRYSKDYKHYELKDFTGLVPIRELEKNEVIRGICQIKDESTGITHIGFVVKTFEGGETWIGSQLAHDGSDVVDNLKEMQKTVGSVINRLQVIKENLEEI